MQKYADVVLDPRGNVVRGAKVLVKTLAGTKAAIFTNAARNPAPNPLTTDNLGRFSFYAENGRYSLDVLVGSRLITSLTDILMEDPMDFSPENIQGGEVRGVSLNGVTIDGDQPVVAQELVPFDQRITDLEISTGGPSGLSHRVEVLEDEVGGPEGLSSKVAELKQFESDLANPDKGAAMVARTPICVDSIAELLALPPGQRKEGVRYLVRRFSVANSSGVGEFYWDAGSTRGADGAYTIAVPGVAVGRFIRLRKEQSIFAQDFGGIVSEGSEVIAKALSLISLLRVGVMVGKGPAGMQTVFLDSRHYQLSSTVNLPFSCEIDGQGSIISAAEGVTRLFYAATAYRVKFKNIIFLGDDVEAFWSESPNLDNARVEFENCFFWTTTRTPDRYAVHIKNQSCRVVFTECDVWDAPNYINVWSDFFYINGGWINGYTSSTGSQKPANSCSIKTRSPTVITNAVFIPEVDGSGVRPGVRWIDSYSAAIHISDSHFGGENGGFPTIYQFMQSATVTVTNSQVSCGPSHPANGIVVLQNNIIPGQYTFSDLRRVVGPVVTSRGYNPALTQAETDELLRARLRAMTAAETAASIVVSQCGSARIPSVIDCITNLHHTQKGSATPVSLPANTTTTLNIAQLYKGDTGVGGEYSTISFKLRAMLSASSSFVGVLQVKEVRVFAHYSTGSPVSVRFVDTAFSESPTGVTPGDTVISFSVVPGSANARGAQLQMTIAAGAWSGISVSYSVSEIDRAESNPARPVGALRLFSHP